MARGIGVHETLQSTLPEWTALGLGLATQLGDVWFCFSVLAVAYLALPSVRERVGTVIALALLASVTVEALKHGLGLPRPVDALAAPARSDEPLRTLLEATATADGHGFPSGHATLSTTVFFGLAGALPGGTARRRALLAGSLVVAISLTRLGLGVHFLADVVTGALLGVLVLTFGAVATRSSPADAPTTVAVVATGVGAVGVAIAAPALDPGGLARAAEGPLLLLGAALGTLAGWQWTLVRTGDVAAAPGRTGRLALAGLSILALLGGGVAGLVTGVLPVALAGAVGLAVAVGLGLPTAVPGFDERVDEAIPSPFRLGRAGSRDGDPSPE